MRFDSKKLILGIVLGLVIAVAIACLVVLIGCAINGVSFSQQIVNWFTTASPVVEQVTDTATHIMA